MALLPTLPAMFGSMVMMNDQALFDGRKGTIALVNAFSRGWTVVFALGDIV